MSATYTALAMGTSLTLVKAASEQADTVLGHLTSIGEVGAEREEIDVTTLDSEDGAREYEAGQLSAGDCPIKGKMKAAADETQITKMMSLLESGETRSWIVTYPSGATFEFDGYLKSFKVSPAEVEGQLEWEGAIRISGLPEFTPAA